MNYIYNKLASSSVLFMTIFAIMSVRWGHSNNMLVFNAVFVLSSMLPLFATIALKNNYVFIVAITTYIISFMSYFYFFSFYGSIQDGGASFDSIILFFVLFIFTSSAALATILVRFLWTRLFH